MVVKSDQDRVRALLTEAITVLCEKRLCYKSQFTVEGLIGITLDADDIFLVSIKETVSKQKSLEVVQEEEKEEVVEDQKEDLLCEKTMSQPVSSGRRKTGGRQRKNTPRHVSLVTPPLQYEGDFQSADGDEEEEEELSWQLLDGRDIDELSSVPHIEEHVSNYSQQQLENGSLQDSNHSFLENGIDAPLNLSNNSSNIFTNGSSARAAHYQNETTSSSSQKRKHQDSCEDGDSQCSSSASVKRPSSSSSRPYSSSLSPLLLPLPLVAIKQEPCSEAMVVSGSHDHQQQHRHHSHHYHSHHNHHHHHHSHSTLSGSTTITTTTSTDKALNNGVMRDTGNILAGRTTNLIESAIWQRLSSPITPLQLSSHMISTQDGAKMEQASRSSSPEVKVTSPMLKIPDQSPQPLLKVPLYSISGKLKKENKPADRLTPASQEPLALNNNNNNNNSNSNNSGSRRSSSGSSRSTSSPAPLATSTPSSYTSQHKQLSAKESNGYHNNNTLDLVLDLEKKPHRKMVNGKSVTKTEAVLTAADIGAKDKDPSDKRDHSYANIVGGGVENVWERSGYLTSSSDGYHSLLASEDSSGGGGGTGGVGGMDQENMEVFSVDSDDDIKTEDFIDRSQEAGKAVSYRCRLCDRVYSNKWNCRRHIQYTHMNKTGFTCEICHNKYRDRSDYQEHMTVIHQGPGGYKCDFCDKILMSKRSLKEHVSLHTGQYRYHCIECSRGFNRLNDYQLHMTKDHGAKVAAAAVNAGDTVNMLESTPKAFVSEAAI